MYYFPVYSNQPLIYSSNKHDGFVEPVNNTNFDFDYVDSKLLNILI